MSLQLTQIGTVPPKVVAHALNVLNKYMAGEIRAHKLVGKHGVSLEVGYRWRLLCRIHDDRKDDNAWLLCSHERYNRFVKGTFS
ncbi:MAG: hypothetical protein RR068_07490 [Hafnia sp.]